jgi:tripartite-type tricarboxylate transporter receptor subunit TctC
MFTRQHWLFLALFLSIILAGGFTGFARAEYPERPITMVVNYSAGGGVDISARFPAQKAEKILGQPIVVVNKAGAGGVIGTGALAAAKPDGYTIGTLTFGPLTMAPHMENLSYNPLKDFDYILGYSKHIYGACVRMDSPFKTLKDLVQYAKANPARIKYSCHGLSIPPHFGMVYLAKAEGIKWDPVVYKNTPEVVAACVGGHVDVVSGNPPDLVPFIKAGRLRLLASFSDIRWKWVPDVPTAIELGYSFALESATAFGAPKGVPKAILDKLRDVFKKTVEDPEFLKIMDNIYVNVAYRNHEEFQKLVELNYKENEAMILELGLHKSQKK